MRTALLLCTVFLFQNSGAQKLLHFSLNFGDEALKTQKCYAGRDDSVLFDAFRFYISDIRFINGDSLLWQDSGNYYLVDISDSSSHTLLLNCPPRLPYNSVSFMLGVDSGKSCGGLFSGALDPLNGMYWSWQSGYIDLKIEGRSPACHTRNNAFQFHLGGYRSPHATRRLVRLDVQKDKDIEILFNIQPLISGIDLSKDNSIMIPGPEAAALMDRIAPLFMAR